jgi:hypothetical protein
MSSEWFSNRKYSLPRCSGVSGRGRHEVEEEKRMEGRGREEKKHARIEAPLEYS